VDSAAAVNCRVEQDMDGAGERENIAIARIGQGSGNRDILIDQNVGESGESLSK
jgi:hypothetical protein